MRNNRVYDNLIKHFFYRKWRRTIFLPTCKSLQCSRKSSAYTFHKTSLSFIYVWRDNLSAHAGQRTSIYHFQQNDFCQSVFTHSATAFPKKFPQIRDSVFFFVSTSNRLSRWKKVILKWLDTWLNVIIPHSGHRHWAKVGSCSRYRKLKPTWYHKRSRQTQAANVVVESCPEWSLE